jgi:transmembrane sensor
MNSNFMQYFDDERFVRWVLSPDKTLNHYWEDYFLKHPGDRAEADKARVILLQLQSEKETASPELATEIYSNIICKIQQPSKRPYVRTVLYKMLRYAAVILLGVLTGGVLVYRYFDEKSEAVYQFVENTSDKEEARLVLADGNVIPLTQKESTVEYDGKGQIIINRQDTIAKGKVSGGDEMNHLIMPYGKSSSIVLPDGTRAYVNAGSRLVYPSEFRGRTREVFLMGEGFFEVAPNVKMPFLVKTNYLNIEATGTSFNVSAYPTDQYIETVLVTGKVLLRENNLKLLKRDMELNPGDAVLFNRETLESSTRRVDTEDYVTWYKGYLNFNSTDLNRAVARLERYYNIRIYLDNPMLGVRRITGKLELGEEQQKVLEVLASTSQSQLFMINETSFGLK